MNPKQLAKFVDENININNGLILEDKNELYHNEWLSLKETPDGYVYSHETRCNGKIVAVLGYKGDKILGRFERNPAHSEKIELCALTGGMDDDNEKPVECAVRELKEEAGITKKISDLKDLGTVRPSKSADTVVYLFAVDCSDVDVGEAKGDGSEGEKGAYCDWVSRDEAIKCKDSLIHTMMLRINIIK